MNATGFLMLVTLFGISAYDFYILKKSKVIFKSCLSSALITLLVNFFVMAIGVGIGSAIFGDGHLSTAVAFIGVVAISYFRFKGREIHKGKVKDKKEKEEKLTPKQKQKQHIEEAAYTGYFAAIVTTIYIFFTMKSGGITADGTPFYFRLVDPVIIGGLAYWTYKKLSFYSAISMTLLFTIGKLMFFIPIYEAGYSGGAGLGLSAIFIFLMVRGTYAAFRYNFNK